MLKAPIPTWDNDGSEFAPYDWWLDGSADYMSNLVYPTNNEEYEWVSVFDPSKRIFRQSYAAAIFFQWMESQEPRVTGAPSAFRRRSVVHAVLHCRERPAGSPLRLQPPLPRLHGGRQG